MTRRVVITGMGTVNSLASDVPGFWSALLAGRSGIGTIEQFDTSAFKVHFGGEVKNFTPESLVDNKTAASAGPLRPVRPGGRRIRRRQGQRPGLRRGRPLPLRRHPRQRHRRPQRVRGAAQPLSRGGSEPHQPVRHPQDDPQRGGRQRLHPVRPVRAEHRRLDRLRLGRPRHRRRHARHPVRLRRRHARRRLGGRHHADGPGRLHLGPRPVAAQRQPAGGEPAVRQGPRRLRPQRGRRHRRAGRAGTRPQARRDASTPSCSASAARPTPTTSPQPHPQGVRGRQAMQPGPARRQAQPGRHPVRQRPRHQHAAGRRGRDDGRQGGRSAPTPASWPSAAPRACSATCSAPAAASS